MTSFHPSDSVLDEEGQVAIPLDPNASDREHWYDSEAGVEREVWRPGDGDGDADSDYYHRIGAKQPIEKRWRFFQVTFSDKFGKKNMPPKHVILDDRSCWDILRSDIPKSHRTDFWSHDFGGPGKIRVRRPHRGRGAIKDPEEPEDSDDRYHHTLIGIGDHQRYVLRGQPGYEPVYYVMPPAQVTPGHDATDESLPGSSAAGLVPQLGEPISKKAKTAHGPAHPIQYFPHEDAAMDAEAYAALPALPKTGVVGPEIYLGNASLNPRAQEARRLNHVVRVGEYEKLVAQVESLSQGLAAALDRIKALEEAASYDISARDDDLE